MEQLPAHFKSGFAALVGRPNVGKSTLMNAVLGMSVSITTPKPQTTRNRIIGVYTDAERGQVVFVDTPGIHRARGRLNKQMVDAAWDALGQTDVVAFVVEAGSLVRHDRPALWGDDRAILDRIGERPCLLLVNKIDLLPRRQDLLPALARVAEEHDFAAVVPVSAKKGTSVDRVAPSILELLDEGPMLYPDDFVTDRAERFLAAEMLREQVMLQTNREVPYGVAVEIDEFADDAGSGRLYVSAVIHVERDSQKGIVIGNRGQRLKQIGTATRARLEQFFGRPVELRTFVRVEADWSTTDRGLHRFGYGDSEI